FSRDWSSDVCSSDLAPDLCPHLRHVRTSTPTENTHPHHRTHTPSQNTAAPCLNPPPVPIPSNKSFHTGNTHAHPRHRTPSSATRSEERRAGNAHYPR